MDRPDERTHGGEAFESPAMPTQAELEAHIDADEAAVAAGAAIELEPVLARMRTTAERVRRDRQHKKATAHRRA